MPESKYLVNENFIYVNNQKSSDKNLHNFLPLQPNTKILGHPLKLGIYNISNSKADSIYLKKISQKNNFREKLLSKKQILRIAERKKNYNDWLEKTGEPPYVTNQKKIKKGQEKLISYFWNKGWFNVTCKTKIEVIDSLHANIYYYINTKKDFLINDISENIASPQIDSLRKTYNKKLKSNTRYQTSNIEFERNDFTKFLRNNGMYHFKRDYIKFEADTLSLNNKVDLTLIIPNRSLVKSDSLNEIPFEIQKIKRINIYTDGKPKLSELNNLKLLELDSINIYSKNKLKYHPKTLISSIYSLPNTIYKDSLRTLTYNSINNLGVFKYPTINYKEIKNSKNELEANIILTPRKKYAFGLDLDVSTSVIQDIGLGFGGSLITRNVFKRAETFEISAYSSIGASQDIADDSNRFFNISELGIESKLSFPRILSPINLSRFIKKSSKPKTDITIGISSQTNIGLDKENVTGGFVYKWQNKLNTSNQFDLFNLQYVRNLNSGNYFNIYANSYNTVNRIAQNTNGVDISLFNSSGNLSIANGSTDQFITNALSGTYDTINSEDISAINSVRERKSRITEDNLILSSVYNYIRDTRNNLYDEDFSRLRFKIESSGFLLNSASQILNSSLNNNNTYELFNVEYSQYFKFENEYIKRWKIDKNNLIAIRTFAGIAIPYGNSNYIPFSQSYFGGGSNDIRAWTAYSLGPGVSAGRNDFNEANFKLLFNIEYRFAILGALKGALFTDAGNIWNVLDEFGDDKEVTFDGFKDLEQIAVGSGIGFRYDFDYFVFRLDTAWKIHNPDINLTKNWFEELNLNSTVLNLGINYPF